MANEKKYVSKINTGSGSYNVKDSEARADIAEINKTLSNIHVDSNGHLILGE